jgi:FkbM family methyltransferase
MIPEHYESVAREMLTEYIQPYHSVLEGGAGIGAVTSVLREGAGFVVAFEPQLEAYLTICDNNPHVFAFCMALSDGPRSLRLHVAEDIGNTSFSEAPDYASYDGFAIQKEQSFPAMPIQVVQDHLLVNALVLDMEGYEIKILRAADLTGVDLVALELHPHRVPAEVIDEGIARLEREGFELAEEREAHPLLPWYDEPIPFPEPGLVYRVYTRSSG